MCRSDSGAASFLGELWEAFDEWRASNFPHMSSLPVLELRECEAILATGEPCLLPKMAVPRDFVQTAADASPTEVSASIHTLP